MADVKPGDVVWVKTVVREVRDWGHHGREVIPSLCGDLTDQTVEVDPTEVVKHEDVAFLLEMCDKADHAIPDEWYDRLEEIRARIAVEPANQLGTS